MPFSIRLLLLGLVFAALALAAPEAKLQERYADAPDTADFDHAAFDLLLKRHVDADGFVDYAALAKARAPLDAYIASLATAPFDKLGRDEKLALLLNAYNAYMLQLVLDNGGPAKVKLITRDIDDPFKKQRWTLAGVRVSLDDVEHGKVRNDFREPRIHWALVCGAFSCPKLRNEAYAGDKLEAQLADQAKFVHTSPRYVQYDGGDAIRLSALYRFYAGDFDATYGGVLESVARDRPDLQAAIEAGRAPTNIQFFDYRWETNDVSNRAMLGSK